MNLPAWFRDASIKRKLLSIGLLIPALALLFVSLILTVKDIVEWRTRTVSELTTYARMIGNNAAPAMLFDDRKAATETLATLAAKPDIVHAVIYDREGKVFAVYEKQSNHPHDHLLTVEPGNYLLNFDYLAIINSIHFKNDTLGSVYLESDLHSLYAGILHSIGLIFLTAFGVFLLAAFLFTKLQKIIVAPILNMVWVMQNVIIEQNFAVRVAPQGKDEAGMLADTFNAMLGYIQLRDAELAEHREHLEKEVVQRTARLTEAQRIAHLGDWEWDITNNKLDWSDEIYRIFCLTPQQFGANYEAFMQAVHPEDRQNVEASVRGALEQGRPYSIDHRILLPDGSMRHVHEQAEVSRNEDGQAIKMLGTVQDITERKRAESALAKSEASMRAILDNSPYLAWLKDMAGRYLAVNEVFLKTTGQKRMQDVLGKTDFDLWPKELAEKYCADDAEVMALRQQKCIEEPALDGDRMYWAETFKTPVIDENGKLLGTTGFARDITERKEYEEELKRSNIELEQFSYAVSHDMRQPLRMISSYLQLLEMSLSGQLDGDKRNYFNSAIEGAKRIDQMLVALLEYSRVGRMGEQPTWIESRAVLDEALQFLQPAITEAQAKVGITGEWPRIFASHDEILRLLQNLIGNAAKFRVAGRTPEITVSSEVVKNEWHLCVADNGVGIIPDQIKRLFQVFQRLQLRTAYEGNGVGLALCRKIAEHHKGRIWAESAGEGLGSRFCVVLPVPQEEI